MFLTGFSDILIFPKILQEQTVPSKLLSVKYIRNFPECQNLMIQLLREAPLRSWESQKLDVPLVCLCVCLSVCLSQIFVSFYTEDMCVWHMALNSVDLKDHKWRFLKKLFKNRPLCGLPSGNELDLDRFLNHFLDTFLTKISTFLMLWLLGNLTQVATSRPCRARCI